MDQLWILVLSVMAPILAFMVALRPVVRDTAKVCSNELELRLDSLDSRLAGIEARLIRLETRWETFDRGLPDLLKGTSTKGNPIGIETRNLYLDKLKARTITADEAAELTEELQAELKMPRKRKIPR